MPIVIWDMVVQISTAEQCHCPNVVNSGAILIPYHASA